VPASAKGSWDQLSIQINALQVFKVWRKRVGVEPTGDRIACRPPVLKTGTITGPHALPHVNNNATDARERHSFAALRG
jgi:hypothetical protein